MVLTETGRRTNDKGEGNRMMSIKITQEKKMTVGEVDKMTRPDEERLKGTKAEGEKDRDKEDERWRQLVREKE